MSVNTVQALYVLSDPAVFGLLCRSPFFEPEEFKKTGKKKYQRESLTTVLLSSTSVQVRLSISVQRGDGTPSHGG